MSKKSKATRREKRAAAPKVTRTEQATAQKADDELCARLDADQRAFAKKTDDAVKAEAEAMHKPAQQKPEPTPDVPAKHWWQR